MSHFILALCLLALAQSSQANPGLVVPEYRLEGIEATAAQGIESMVGDLKAGFRQNLPPAEQAALYGALGQLFHAYDLRNQAVESYERARLLAPSDGRWPYLMAVLLTESGQSEAAESALQQARAAQPDYLPAIVRLAALYRDRGQLEKAELVISHLAVGDDSPPETLAALGEHYLQTERPAEALELLSRAVALKPEANRLNYLVGQAYRALGERRKAREALQRSGEVGLVHADPWLTQVQALARGELLALQVGQRAYNAGDFVGAVRAFRQALQAEPDSARARVNLAAALAEAGDVSGAIEQFEQALERDPENLTSLYNLATIYLANGRLERADEMFARVLQQRPDDVQAHLQRAQLLRAAGQLELALHHANRARSAVETYRPAVLLEVEILVAAGRSAEALGLMNDAYAIFPADPQIAVTRANLLATVPPPEGNPEEALKLARLVEEKAPSSASAEAVALALAALNRCAESAQWLRKAAAEADSGNRERLNRMAQNVAGRQNCRPDA